jgi:hypothetical protein
MRRTPLIWVGLLLLFIAVPDGWGQVHRRSMSLGSPPSRVGPEFYFSKPTHLIDMPTANILYPGDMKASLRLYEEGGILGRLSVGISTRMMFGVSYSADHLIGDQIVQWGKTPCVHFAYRFKEETLKGPAMVVGLDTQGYGKYWNRADYPDSLYALSGTEHHLNRYSIKSKGLYVVASKNFDSFWNVNLHVGANLSLEKSDGDTDPDIFMGLYLQFSQDLAAIVEYDAGMNDDRLKDLASRRGYLNAGIRWSFERRLFLEADMKNLLMNPQGKRDYIRILRIGYHTTVFN